ncbi:MAG: helix-turn-helix transcriptional regulator [Anaerolineales bacterium]|nr:helix-turn-helix transcriptional regulator [Anaerolineales bacterium]
MLPNVPIHSAVQPPTPPLDRYIEVLWYQHIPIYSAREIILPSPHLELIFNFGEPHKVFTTPDLAQFTTHEKAWLAGLQSRYFAIESRTSHMIGARLKPAGAAAFFPGDISQLSDRVTPFDAIIGAEAAAALHAALSAATEDATRFAVLEDFLLQRLQESRPGLELALEAVQRIQAAEGNLGIAELSTSLHVSHKHLIEVFTATVGLRPKQFARVIRFSSLLPELFSSNLPDWAALAHKAGYHDQSHFNREFQLFAGLTPSQYIELRSHYSNYGSTEDSRFVPLG